jgi:hypothetical protein
MLTILAMISTDYTGKCKSNFYLLLAAAAPYVCILK